MRILGLAVLALGLWAWWKSRGLPTSDAHLWDAGDICGVIKVRLFEATGITEMDTCTPMGEQWPNQFYDVRGRVLGGSWRWFRATVDVQQRTVMFTEYV